MDHHLFAHTPPLWLFSSHFSPRRGQPSPQRILPLTYPPRPDVGHHRRVQDQAVRPRAHLRLLAVRAALLRQPVARPAGGRLAAADQGRLQGAARAQGVLAQGRAALPRPAGARALRRAQGRHAHAARRPLRVELEALQGRDAQHGMCVPPHGPAARPPRGRGHA